MSEPDLRCLLAKNCTEEEGCAYSRRHRQCIPKDVYNDIGYVMDGGKAREYFRALPAKILKEHGEISLNEYCQKQSLLGCHAPCGVSINGTCVSAQRRWDVLPSEERKSMIKHVYDAFLSQYPSFTGQFTLGLLVVFIDRHDLFLQEWLRVYAYLHHSPDFISSVYRSTHSVNEVMVNLFGLDLTRVVTGPIYEELLVRGSMLLGDSVIDQVMDKIVKVFNLDPDKKATPLKIFQAITLLSQATLFSAGHFTNGRSPAHSMIFMYHTFWSGMVLGALARKYHLKASIGVHGMNNLIVAMSTKPKLFVLSFLPTLCNLASIAHNWRHAANYQTLLLHSQRFLPPPSGNVVAEHGHEVFHDTVQDIEEISRLEINNITKFEIETKLEWFYDALTTDDQYDITTL
jgi:membrane protease YdiL (CAAX protease family)